MIIIKNVHDHLFSSWDPKICCILEWVCELSWFLACWLWCTCLVRPVLYYISLAFKSQSTAIALVRLPAVAGRILWNGVCPSFHPAIYRLFSWNWIMRFLWIWHGARNPYEVVRDRARNTILRKILFLRCSSNALSQSDCRIFKSIIFLAEMDETASFFACWYKFTKIIICVYVKTIPWKFRILNSKNSGVICLGSLKIS